VRNEKKGAFLESFIAVLYYEFLWNLRKKKLIGMFILVLIIGILYVALPPILSNISGRTFQQDPNFVFRNVGTLNGFLIFLLAIAATMNTISGEFETGSIFPLLTKPVTRSSVFFGKMFVAFVSLMVVFSFMAFLFIVGGWFTRGPQDNLDLVPLGVVGLTTGTMVWASITVLLGTLSKNSMVAALGSFGAYIGITIVAVLLSQFFGQTYIIFFTPGDGATGSLGACSTSGSFGETQTFSTGTNALGLLLMQWALNPNQLLNFCGFRFGGGRVETFLLSSQNFSSVAANSLGVSLVYIEVLLTLSWAYFRHSEILE